MTEFSYTVPVLSQLVEYALEQAKHQGATACAAEVSEGIGQSVSVRLGEVETLEYNADKSFGVTVYNGQRVGHASTADFSREAIAAAVQAAVDIAHYTAADDCAGLADADDLARKVVDCDLYHPWGLSVDAAISLAQQCEQAAMDVSPSIQNSEGASISSHQNQFVYGNSHGFIGGYAGSRHSLSCSVIAQSGDDMQRDYWYSSGRSAVDLLSPEQVGKMAAERAVQRLGAQRLKTTACPVLFDSTVAGGLIGSVVGAVSGAALYRKNSFLLDSLGTQILPAWVNIQEFAHLPKGAASAPFDNEGVATKDRDWIKAGILQGYFLGSYSARKLGMRTTGHAGGAHNLAVSSTGQNLAELLRLMGTGLWVTHLMGQGVNALTGDYSRGASGFWVEGGVIQYPVEEITIAGNLKEMLMQIVAIGTDYQPFSSKKMGSVLIENMTVAGV